ncbi:MAG: glycosyltransferase family 4 protein [Vicinamibacterales bacterium]|nr:glycosyltransferase family 4 protein [Vicinamibacterales bacterium]
MHVWLVQLGEPVPGDLGSRQYRTGYLAEALASRGHTVTWWTSSFSHYRKAHRTAASQRVVVSPGFAIEFLHAPGYRKNTSVSRLWFHHKIAREFRRRSVMMDTPSIVLAGFPTPGLADAAVRYGVQRGVPVVVDVRDLWPDVFMERVPTWLSGVLHLGLGRSRNRNRHIFSRSSGIVAISSSYLRWALAHAGREAGASDRVVYLGYPEFRVDPGARNRARAAWLERGVRPDAFVCCFFGTINHYFDIATVIDAARKFERDGTSGFQFVLCGEGHDLARYKTMASGLTSVTFPGWVDAAEIAALSELSRVGLAPYASTATMSLPNKPFEYFCAGLPVVSSLRGELASILTEGECGVSYAAGDSAALSAALAAFRANEPRRTLMGRNARRLYEERYSSERVSRDLMNHLESLVTPSMAT